MDTDVSQVPTVGLLTRTLSVSPVVRWILPLFKSHLVCVGDDFAHRYSINSHHGWMQYEESFPRIPGRILYVAMFPDTELSTGKSEGRTCELVLTLDQGILFAFEITEDTDGIRVSPAKSYPLPRTDDPLRSSGTLLAAEAHSRTVVVGSRDNHLIFFNAHREPSRGTILCRDDCGYSASKKSQNLLHMTFLQTEPHPDASRPLLLITSSRTKLFAQTLELTRKEGKTTVTLLNTQRIDIDNSLPDLLIPSKTDQSFLLAGGPGLFVFDEILSGHAKQTRIKGSFCVSPNSGQSSLVWTSSAAHPLLDSVLIFGENGLVVYFDFDQYRDKGSKYTPVITRQSSLAPHANAVHWFAGDGAFDCLVFRGSTGRGSVCRTILKIDHTGEEPTALVFDTCQNSAGWALGLDLVVSRLPRSKESPARRTDGLFIAYGSNDRSDIIELRPGDEAHLTFALDIGSDFSPSTIWSAPFTTSTESIFLLSGYGSNLNSLTKAVMLDEAGVDMAEHVDLASNPELDERLRGIDLSTETICVSTGAVDGFVYHVTRKTVARVSPVESSGGVVFSISDHDTGIIAADILRGEGCVHVVLATSNTAHDIEPPIKLHFLIIQNTSLQPEIESHPLRASVTAMKLLLIEGEVGAAVATRDGVLAIHRPGQQGGEVSHQFTEQTDSALPTTTESIEVIHVDRESSRVSNGEDLLLCSLRDGSIELVGLQRQKGMLNVYPIERIPLGVTTVLMTQLQIHGRNESEVFLAACESNLFTLTVTIHQHGPRIQIHPLWITDRDEPGFAHDNISAITQIKHHDIIDGSDLFGNIAVIMGSRFLIATAPQSVGHAIPRTLHSHSQQKSASPVRVMYSARLAHFVLAMVERGERLDTNSPTQFFRSYIEYRPVTTTILDGEAEARPPVQALLQAGEKVNSLVEWVYHNAEKKKYVFTLVGTGRTLRSEDDKTAKTRGRIHILQPAVRGGRVDTINFSNYIKFDDPVYAIAMVSPVAFVCSHGNLLSCYLYLAESRKWQSQSFFRLSSPATNITFDDQFVHITTTLDSLMTFSVNITPNDMQLSLLATDSSQALGMHHQTMPISWTSTPPSQRHGGASQFISVLSTKTGQLHGFMNPGSTTNSSAAMQCRRLFTAQLPRAITRLRIAETSIDPLVKQNSIIGLTTDGTIYGVSLLEVNTWARLKYLESLVLRSERDRLCHHSSSADADDMHTLPRHSTGLAGLSPYANEPDPIREGRTGFSTTVPRSTTTDPIPTDTSGWRPLPYVPRPTRLRPEDMHVHGDVLATLFVLDDIGPVERVRRLLRAEAERDDALGQFAREHAEEEMQLVPETVKLAEDTLKAWGFW